MRRRSLAICCVATAAIIPPPPADAARSDCYPRGTKTAEASKDARVYTRGRSDNLRVYACLYSTGRSRPLGTNESGEFGPDSETIAGRYVAYVYFDGPTREDKSQTQVRVIDLKTGRIRRSSDRGPGGGFGGLVVNRTGATAWIWARGSGTEVRKIDADGEGIVDTGPADGGSLALAGSRLYWTRDGSPMTALLH